MDELDLNWDFNLICPTKCIQMIPMKILFVKEKSVGAKLSTKKSIARPFHFFLAETQQIPLLTEKYIILLMKTFELQN